MTSKRSIALLTCFLVSCSTDSVRELLLLEAQPEPEEPQDEPKPPEGSARDARMNITLDIEGFGTTEYNPFQFATYVAQSCETVILPLGERTVDPDFMDYWAPCMSSVDQLEETGVDGTTGCPLAYCRISRKLCEANMMLEFAAAAAPIQADVFMPVRTIMPGYDGYDESSGAALAVTVPPQETDARASLAELALLAASETAIMASQNLTFLATGEAPESAADGVLYLPHWGNNIWHPIPVLPGGTGDLLCSSDPDDKADMTVGELWSDPLLHYPMTRRRVIRPELIQNTQTMAEAIATMMLEATTIAAEATDLATQLHLDAADAEYSTNTDRADAAQQAWTGTTLSRARAAHINVGGQLDGGLHNLWGQGICPMDHLDNAGEAALDYFRQSAMDPKLIAGDTAIEYVMLGTNADPFESMRGRLADRIPNDTLADLELEELLEELQLPLSAFTQARQYLKHEQVAFGRDLHLVSPAHAVGMEADGSAPIFAQPGFAATAMGPTIPPPMYYAGLTRFPLPWDSDWLSWCPAPRDNYQGDVDPCRLEHIFAYVAQLEDRSHHLGECFGEDSCGEWAECLPSNDGVDRCFHKDNGVVVPTGGYARRSFSHLMDYVASVTHDLPRFAQDFGGDLPASVSDLLARSALELSKQRPSRVETCYNPSGSTSEPDEFRIRVMGLTDAANGEASLMLVREVSGLRCAVDGNVEGVSCDLEDYVVEIEDFDYFRPSDRPFGMGFTDYTQLDVELNLNSDPIDWLYLVRKRDGRPRMEPGSYEALTVIKTQRMTDDMAVSTWGGSLPQPTDPSGVESWRWCSVAPVVPERIDLVGRILAPNEDNCTQADVTCAGFEFAERIPLENELIDNRDGVEDSWRHYLDAAMDAAAAADALGEELIERGFQIDERIETATAEIEGVCGGAISIRDLAWGSLEDTRVGDCSTDADSCPALYTCLDGQCVKDLDKSLAAVGNDDPEAQAILDCVGDGSIVPWAALSDAPICVWRSPLDDEQTALDPDSDGYSQELCENPPGSVPANCPYFATSADFETAECDFPDGLPPDWRVQVVEHHLDVFTPQVSGGEPEIEEDDFDCELIREARRTGDHLTAQQAAAEVVDKLRINHGIASGLASRIGWDSYPGNHGAITIDGEIKWATGMPNVEGAEPYFAGGWPCDASHPSVATQFQSSACGNGSNVASNPLFQSFACGCADEDSDVGPVTVSWHRPAMTQRLARAVIAAKIITGAPMSNVKVPFQPHLHSYVWNFDTDADACSDEDANYCDFEQARWKWEEGVTNYDLFGGRVLNSGSGLYWKVWGDGEDRRFYQDGEAFCHPSDLTTWAIWSDPTAGDLAPHCGTYDRRRHSATGEHYPILMRAAEDVAVDQPTARLMWDGMHPEHDPSESPPGGTNGLILELLRNPGSRDFIALDQTRGGTDYFHQCHGRRGDYSEWGPHNCPGGLKEHYFNRLHMAPDGLTGHEVLDAVELICEVGAKEGFGCEEVSGAPPSSMQDLAFVRDAMGCVSDSIRTEAAMTIFRDVPDTLLPENASPDAYQGERGAELSSLMGGLLQLHELENNIANIIDQFSEDVEILRNGVRRFSVLQQLSELEAESQIMDRMAACTASAARTAGNWFAPKELINIGSQIGNTTAMAIECGNAVAQVSFAFERLDLQEEDLELQGEMAWSDFRKRFIQARTDLNNTVGDINTVLHDIGGALAAAESHRQRARRMLGQGLMLTADAQGRTFATNAVMRARYNTVRIRYEQALQYAKYMSYMSRRALEQRIGIDLMDIEDDMAFVDAPSTWADAVCTFSGIDYGSISSGNLEGENYANAYIGDYVTKLHQVFESYSIDFPFHEGQDTAVVSVRDDIVMSRGLCEAEANNLLANSAALDEASWRPTGCIEYEVDPADVCQTEDEEDCSEGDPDVEACVRVVQLGEEDRYELPIPLHEQVSGAVDGFEVTFAPGISDPATERSSLDPGVTALGQTVTLEPGTYRLSWRARDAGLPGEYLGRDAVDAVELIVSNIIDPVSGDIVDTEIVEQDVNRSPVHTVDGIQGWPQHFFVFEVEEFSGLDTGALGARDVRIEIRSDSDSTALTEYTLNVAAFMLENVTGETTVDAAALYDPGSTPQTYAATGEAGIAMLPVCEDTDGTSFRQGWTYGCEKLCPGGFATCADGESHCYFERELSMSLDSIEDQSHLSRAGFAIGNYNYRIDSLALNFVGTNTRDCSDSSAPSTCYGSGFIPYSIYHDGSFEVRNHLGEAYEAPLFRGVIEHAKGLAAERYVTNPISTADHALLDSYVRHEFAGRPLPGRYTVRIWNEDGVNFEGLEDVQVVVNYRYWTRNE